MQEAPKSEQLLSTKDSPLLIFETSMQSLPRPSLVAISVNHGAAVDLLEVATAESSRYVNPLSDHWQKEAKRVAADARRLMGLDPRD